MKKFIILLSVIFNSISWGSSTLPEFNKNDLNIVFVQPFEYPMSLFDSSQKALLLNSEGYNHAFRFGQLLNTLTSGDKDQVQQLYAFTLDNNDLTGLQSLEHYAVLNDRSIKYIKVKEGSKDTYNSPAFLIQQIINNQPRGIYMVAMPSKMIEDSIYQIAGQHVRIRTQNQFAVLTMKDKKNTATVYDDQISSIPSYPKLNLAGNASCPQQPASFSIKAPDSIRHRLNKSMTVYFVRHVEAHPTGSFENGNYVCQGQWRAQGANPHLLKKMGNVLPDVVFSSNTAGIIDGGAAYSYIRPTLTVAPFAIQYNVPMALAKFQWDDAPSLATALFMNDAPYSDPALFNGKKVLVGWEHGNIEKAVSYLLSTIYKSSQNPPAWSFTDYDSIWEISINEQGDLTFRNSCEGIATQSLPSTCPSFFNGE